ncbi:hypothetical protein RCH09_003922 [Actimicrobium sp. GrIS 1.19]|nr:hypothetical protein [Actimicrobium sp. GrIS 1.19]
MRQLHEVVDAYGNPTEASNVFRSDRKALDEALSVIDWEADSR